MREEKGCLVSLGAGECSNYFFFLGKTKVLTEKTQCFVSLVVVGLTMWADMSATPVPSLC